MAHPVCPCLAPFLRYSKILVENRQLNLTHLYLAPPLGWPLPDFWHQQSTVPGLSYGVVCVIPHLAVLIQYWRATDGRADGWTHDDSIYRARIASRGKKSPQNPAGKLGMRRNRLRRDEVSVMSVTNPPTQCLKQFEKAEGAPSHLLPFPLSPPSVYHHTPPELGGWVPPSPLTLSPAPTCAKSLLLLQHESYDCDAHRCQSSVRQTSCKFAGNVELHQSKMSHSRVYVKWHKTRMIICITCTMKQKFCRPRYNAPQTAGVRIVTLSNLYALYKKTLM